MFLISIVYALLLCTLCTCDRYENTTPEVINDIPDYPEDMEYFPRSTLPYIKNKLTLPQFTQGVQWTRRYDCLLFRSYTWTLVFPQEIPLQYPTLYRLVINHSEQLLELSRRVLHFTGKLWIHALFGTYECNDCETGIYNREQATYENLDKLTKVIRKQMLEIAYNSSRVEYAQGSLSSILQGCVMSKKNRRPYRATYRLTEEYRNLFWVYTPTMIKYRQNFNDSCSVGSVRTYSEFASFSAIMNYLSPDRFVDLADLTSSTYIGSYTLQIYREWCNRLYYPKHKRYIIKSLNNSLNYRYTALYLRNRGSPYNTYLYSYMDYAFTNDDFFVLRAPGSAYGAKCSKHISERRANFLFMVPESLSLYAEPIRLRRPDIFYDVYAGLKHVFPYSTVSVGVYSRRGEKCPTSCELYADINGSTFNTVLRDRFIARNGYSFPQGSIPYYETELCTNSLAYKNLKIPNNGSYAYIVYFQQDKALHNFNHEVPERACGAMYADEFWNRRIKEGLFLQMTTIAPLKMMERVLYDYKSVQTVTGLQFIRENEDPERKILNIPWMLRTRYCLDPIYNPEKLPTKAHPTIFEIPFADESPTKN